MVRVKSTGQSLAVVCAIMRECPLTCELLFTHFTCKSFLGMGIAVGYRISRLFLWGQFELVGLFSQVQRRRIDAEPVDVFFFPFLFF